MRTWRWWIILSLIYQSEHLISFVYKLLTFTSLYVLCGVSNQIALSSCVLQHGTVLIISDCGGNGLCVESKPTRGLCLLSYMYRKIITGVDSTPEAKTQYHMAKPFHLILL